MKAIAEFLLLALFCAVALLLCLYAIGESNWERENCVWNEKMELQCRKE